MSKVYKKSVVFTMPNGKVVAIEKVQAQVVNDYLVVPASIHRRFGHLFAYWRGMHYSMKSETV